MSNKKIKEEFSSKTREEKERIKKDFQQTLPEEMSPLFKTMVAGAMDDILDPEDDECGCEYCGKEDCSCETDEDGEYDDQ